MKKILFSLFVFSLLFVGFQAKATSLVEEELVCCERYGMNITGVRVSSTFSIIEKSKCYIPSGSDGANERIVDMKYCKTTINCPIELVDCVSGFGPEYYEGDDGCMKGRCVPIKTTDKKCLPGYKYSPMTGELCPDNAINDGCLPGYKYSPVTGQKCVDVIISCTESGSNCGVRNYGISKTLKIGEKSEEVKILQKVLNILEDGSFGPMTKQKLIEWQAQNGLTPDGVFGPKSREKAGL